MASNLKLWLEEGKALSESFTSRKSSKKGNYKASEGSSVSWRKRDKEGNIVPKYFISRKTASLPRSAEFLDDVFVPDKVPTLGMPMYIYKFFPLSLHSYTNPLVEHLQRLRTLIQSIPDVPNLEVPAFEVEDSHLTTWAKRQKSSETKYRACFPELLNAMLAAETVANPCCQRCSSVDAVVRCLNCVPSGAHFFCASCDRSIHTKHVFHDREAIFNGFFQPISPTNMVVVEQGGRCRMEKQVCLLPITLPAQICPCGSGQDFTVCPGKLAVLVTINGPYYVNLPVVCCPLCSSKWTPTINELIAHKFWPGNMSCQLLINLDVFTSFEHIKLASPALSLDAFVKMLEHRAHGTGRTGTICADAFHKAFREFAFCKFKMEELCLREPFVCQACVPEMLAISADGNRKHYRYKKSKGTDEPPLFEGVFIAPDAKVSTFVDEVRAQMITKNGHDTCGPATFAAGRESSHKSRAKVDEEGLETSVCRHGVLLRALNHYRGEIYAYPLYLQKELSQTARATFFCMDIACRYWPYVGKMAERLPDLKPLTQMRPFLSVMHAKAHTGKCEVKWGGRSQDGAGNTVGEEVEQVNSFLSRAALTTKYMTKSGRVDMVTVLAMGWNKRKMQGLHKTLVKRFAKTTQRAETEAANLERLRQEHNISLEDTEQWVLDVRQWAASEEHATAEGLQKDIEELLYSIKRKKHDLYRQNDSNQTRHRKRKRIAELKQKLNNKVQHYNTAEGAELHTEALLADNVTLPWEAQEQGASFRLKRQLFDLVMLVRRLEEEKLLIVKEMIQHCQYLRGALDNLENRLHQTKEDVTKNTSDSAQLTEEGYRGLLCCLLHKRHLQHQQLIVATTSYSCVDSNPSFVLMEDDVDREEEFDREEEVDTLEECDISSSEEEDL